MKTATTTMKKSKSGSKQRKDGDSPAELIDARIKELSDWRGEALARVRNSHQAGQARSDRGVEVVRSPGVVARRNNLHR